MHIIITEVGPACHWNRGIILESVYAITFITCPKTWVYGIRYALRKVRDSRNLFLFNFIEGVLLKYGSTGGGEGRRRQPSRNKASLHTTIRSLMNIDSAIDAANKRSITPKALLNQLSGDWQEGGVFGARKLIAMEIICICTMIGLIEDSSFSAHTEITETQTKRRLADFGIKSPAELADLVRIVAIRFCNGCYITAENLICEVLRDGSNRKRRRKKKDGKDIGPNAFDTVMKGQLIYDMIEDRLFGKQMQGSQKWERIELEQISHCGFYDPYLKWWEIGREILRGGDQSIPINVKM